MIPKHVQIGGFTYNVELSDDPLRHVDDKGCTVSHLGIIPIDKSLPPDQQEETLIHEIFHTIFSYAKIELDEEKEEDIISRISPVWHMVLFQNDLFGLGCKNCSNQKSP